MRSHGCYDNIKGIIQLTIQDKGNTSIATHMMEKYNNNHQNQTHSINMPIQDIVQDISNLYE